jgi:hypothetical protein
MVSQAKICSRCCVSARVIDDISCSLKSPDYSMVLTVIPCKPEVQNHDLRSPASNRDTAPVPQTDRLGMGMLEPFP